jgi:hypothetical protein
MKTSSKLALLALLAIAAGIAKADDGRALDTASAADTLDRTALQGSDVRVSPQPVRMLEPYDWKTTEAERRAIEWPAEEPTEPYSRLMLIVPTVLMFAFAIFGLAFAYRSMRSDMRNQRVLYRPRGPARPSALE